MQSFVEVLKVMVLSLFRYKSGKWQPKEVEASFRCAYELPKVSTRMSSHTVPGPSWDGAHIALALQRGFVQNRKWQANYTKVLLPSADSALGQASAQQAEWARSSPCSSPSPRKGIIAQAQLVQPSWAHPVQRAPFTKRGCFSKER